jgi:hypothetical protein
MDEKEKRKKESKKERKQARKKEREVVNYTDLERKEER